MQDSLYGVFSRTILIEQMFFTDRLTNIDMMFNPDKITQYQIDKDKALADIRDEKHQMCSAFCYNELNQIDAY